MAPADLTVEQLAAETGMSVRNIRSHQARGLLAPPQVRLRVGYYGPEHVAQLRRIRELQEQGFNLAGIKRLLDEAPGTAEQLLELKRSIAEDDPAPGPVLSASELARRFGLDGEEARHALSRARALGVLTPAGADSYEVLVPELVTAAEEAVRHGIPVVAAIAVIEDLDRHSDAVAEEFVRLFVREVWAPLRQAEMEPARWAELAAAIATLRPLASEAVIAVFQRRLGARIEAAFDELVDTLGQVRE